MSSIESFFSSVTKKVLGDLDFDSILFIAVSEWNWSTTDFYNCSIPDLIMLLDKRNKVLEKERKSNKKI